MTSNAPLSVAAGTTAFALDDELILLEEDGQALLRLNSTAALIWSAVANGLGSGEIADHLADAHGQARDSILRHVHLLIDDWMAAGVLRSPRSGALAPEPRPRELTAAAPDLPASDPRRLDYRFERHYRILDLHFALRTNADEILAKADTVIGQLEVPEDPKRRADRVVEIVADGPEWIARVDGITLLSCPDLDAVGPMLHGLTLRLGYTNSDCLAGIHGAAIAGEQGCALMPATSGSGKSTLTAAMLSAGFTCYTDDLAILTHPPIRLRPLPLRLGLKEPSWQLLEQRLPQLADLPAHRRLDEKVLKYLPISTAKSHLDPVEISCLVYPLYTPGAAARLEPIGRGEALYRITRAGYDATRRLDSSWVSSLVSWLEDLDCYELRFDDLGTAVDSLSDLLD